jgi:hypothetical protein
MDEANTVQYIEDSEDTEDSDYNDEVGTLKGVWAEPTDSETDKDDDKYKGLFKGKSDAQWEEYDRKVFQSKGEGKSGDRSEGMDARSGALLGRGRSEGMDARSGAFLGRGRSEGMDSRSGALLGRGRSEGMDSRSGALLGRGRGVKWSAPSPCEGGSSSSGLDRACEGGSSSSGLDRTFVPVAKKRPRRSDGSIGFNSDFAMG